MGLKIVDVAADGHCLYRSIASALVREGDAAADFISCRREIAGYIRAHPHEFAPYILAASEREMSNTEEVLEAYCEKVERSAEWGGQIELTAFSLARERCVAVYSAGAPVIKSPRNPPRMIGRAQPCSRARLSECHRCF